MEIVRTTGLSKVYGEGANATHALTDVSLSIEKGEFVAVVGPSGSGKSTLLHLLGGVDRPTSGSVCVNGCDVFAQNDEQLAVFRRREVGLVYQFFNLVPVLTVVENIMLPQRLDGRTPDPAATAALVKKLGLVGREDHLPNQLSGGQQQRVSIGRALANHPSILLADEPTGNLDSKSSAEVMALLRRANQEEGQTLVVITHDNELACAADRVVTVEDGRVVRDERVR
jgi:putative ABC transport system ATP-binding protein